MGPLLILMNLLRSISLALGFILFLPWLATVRPFGTQKWSWSLAYKKWETKRSVCPGAPQGPGWHLCMWVSVIASQPVVVPRHHHLLVSATLETVSFLHPFLSMYQIFTNDGIMCAGSYLYNCILDSSEVLVGS